MMLIRNALILAGVILAFSLGLTLAVRNDLIEASTMQRAQGVMAGLVLVLVSNLVPKTLEPLSATRCGPLQTQAVRRFAGWTLVLAGLGQAIGWLVLPIERANSFAILVVGTGLVMVLARVAWAYLSGPRAEPPAELGS